MSRAAASSSRKQKKQVAQQRTPGRPSGYGSEVDELDSSMDEKEDYNIEDEDVKEDYYYPPSPPTPPTIIKTTSKSAARSTAQSTAQSTSQSTVQPTVQSTVQPTVQSTVQPPVKSTVKSTVKSARPAVPAQSPAVSTSSASRRDVRLPHPEHTVDTSSRQNRPPRQTDQTVNVALAPTDPRVVLNAQAATNNHALTMLVNQLLDGQRLQAERIAALESAATANDPASSTTAVATAVATAVDPEVATSTPDIWAKHWQVHEEHRQAALEGKLGLEYHHHFLPFRVVSDVLSGRYRNPNQRKAMASREQLSHEMRLVQHLVIHLPGPAAFGIAWQTCISLMMHGLGPSQAIKGIALSNAMNDYSAFLMEKAMSCSWETVMRFHAQYCAPRFGSLHGASDPSMWPVPVDDGGPPYSMFEEETRAQFQGARVGPPAASAPNNNCRMPATPIEPQPTPPAATNGPPKNRERGKTVSNVPPSSNLAYSSSQAKIRAESSWRPAATGANAQAVPTMSRQTQQSAPAPVPYRRPSVPAPAPEPQPQPAPVPATRPAKRKRSQETETVPNDKPCYNWNTSTCPEPCSKGKVHSCRRCITGEHRMRDCPDKRKSNPPERPFKGKPCYNWNFLSCDTPCANGRDHICRLCKSPFHNALWCKDSYHYKAPRVDEAAISCDSL